MLLWGYINCLDKKPWIPESHPGSNPKNPLLWPHVTSSRWKQVCSSPLCSYSISFSCNLPAGAVASLLWSLSLPKVGWYKCKATPPGLAWRTMQGSPCQSSTWPAHWPSAWPGQSTLRPAWPDSTPTGLAHQRSTWPGLPCDVKSHSTSLFLLLEYYKRQENYVLQTSRTL
jgi:hypothetical protein